MQAISEDEPKSVKSQVIDLAVKEGAYVLHACCGVFASLDRSHGIYYWYYMQTGIRAGMGAGVLAGSAVYAANKYSPW